MKKYLAIDLGGTFIKLGIINEKGEILETSKVQTPKSLDELLGIIRAYKAFNKGVVGIAMSSPGAVSEEGIVYGSSAVPYIHGFNIKKVIQERTDLPLFMENDANCAGLAEMWTGAGNGKSDVLVMVIGTGIGGAIIKNGELHKGANLHGGEFGYMLLNSDFKDSNDIWSRVASTKALIRSVAEKKQIDTDLLSGEAIFSMASSGDKVCIDALERFYHLLAVGIYNLQYIYDPEIILIGGGISQREDLINRIDEKLERILSMVDLAKIKPTIDTCMHRQNANLLGAVYGFMKSQNNTGIIY